MSETDLVDELLRYLEGVDVSGSIEKLFNTKSTDRSLINVLMRVFPMGTARGNLAMSIAEAILRIPDNKKKDEIISQMKIPLPAPLLRVLAELSVRVLSSTLIAGSTIEKANGSDLSSFDMLGESAVTYQQAKDYFEKYRHAALTVNAPSEISIKLSSLHPRYEYLQQRHCIPEIVEKVKRIAAICDSRGIGITIDAEESDRLDLSMMVIDSIHCDKLTVTVQANQKRAMGVIQYLNSLDRNIGIRLVKGAYWDTEIKMAQERGLDYPVFTSKENTNISYLACSKFMLDSENIIPKFATHNPSTVGAVLGLTKDKLEFQRLYGMGSKLHKLIEKLGHTSRAYKPIGTAKDLLAYLIRRMMENGANTSFVMHESIENHTDRGKGMGSYESIYNLSDRLNSKGMDFSNPIILKEMEAYYDKRGEQSR
jgi:hypothetical protein